VGSHVALTMKQAYQAAEVVALDNLRRRGSELNLSRLARGGVKFVHGDVRNREDLESFKQVSLLVECSAEPSVLASYEGGLDYVIQTNLVGTLNCLELARCCGADVVFLSTSRVYPIKSLNALELDEGKSRLVPAARQTKLGFGAEGVAESFPLHGSRSVYGATKLASELILQEYIDAHGIRGVINRCGVLTGPWQMGKVDQGFVVLWASRHLFGRPLSYIGYGGSGKQVRDILHISDLCTLLLAQIARMDQCNGEVFNVGGGVEGSVSLQELTDLTVAATGSTTTIERQLQARSGDVPYYVSDCAKVRGLLGWEPQVRPAQIVEEVVRWIGDHRAQLEPILS